MMEVFAGFLSHTDYHIGRLLNFLKTIGEFDNTLIMVLSDNGASAEGGPQGSINESLFFNNVPEDLADNIKMLDKNRRPRNLQPLPLGLDLGGQHAFSSLETRDLPRRHKRPLHCSLVQRHPSKRANPNQYAHAIDLLPTVLDALEMEAPETIQGVTQSPIQGVSFAHTFNEANAETKHHTQYFEMLGHRSIYQDGWRAVCPWPGPSFAEAGKTVRYADFSRRTHPVGR